jgi:hypothetical protein
MMANPSIRPFQSTGVINLPAGVFVGQANLATVPNGKVLVIEFISAAINLPVGQALRTIILHTIVFHNGGSTQTQHFLLPVSQGVPGLLTVSQKVRLYSNASGTTFPVRVEIQRDSGNSDATAQFALSGHLLDFP